MQANLPENIKHLYPFKSHYRELSCGYRMHYVDEGRGVPVVMVHGNPTWSFYYRNLMRYLSGDYRSLAMDHIGCGLSDKPQDYGYYLQNHIDNLVEWFEALNLEYFHLVVHDWGGPIGLGLAEAFADRVGKIVFLNTSGFLSKEVPLRIKMCKVPFFGELAVRGLNAFAGAATFMAVKKPMLKEVREGFLYPYNNWANRIATHRFVKDIPLSVKHPSYPTMKRIEESLGGLRHKPVMLYWGGQDFCFTRHYFEGMQAIFPKAQTHYIENAGHYVLEDDTKNALKVIKAFLDS